MATGLFHTISCFHVNQRQTTHRSHHGYLSLSHNILFSCQPTSNYTHISSWLLVSITQYLVFMSTNIKLHTDLIMVTCLYHTISCFHVNQRQITHISHHGYLSLSHNILFSCQPTSNYTQISSWLLVSITQYLVFMSTNVKLHTYLIMVTCLYHTISCFHVNQRQITHISHHGYLSLSHNILFSCQPTSNYTQISSWLLVSITQYLVFMSTNVKLHTYLIMVTCLYHTISCFHVNQRQTTHRFHHGYLSLSHNILFSCQPTSKYTHISSWLLVSITQYLVFMSTNIKLHTDLIMVTCLYHAISCFHVNQCQITHISHHGYLSLSHNILFSCQPTSNYTQISSWLLVSITQYLVFMSTNIKLHTYLIMVTCLYHTISCFHVNQRQTTYRSHHGYLSLSPNILFSCQPTSNYTHISSWLLVFFTQYLVFMSTNVKLHTYLIMVTCLYHTISCFHVNQRQTTHRSHHGYLSLSHNILFSCQPSSNYTQISSWLLVSITQYLVFMSTVFKIHTDLIMLICLFHTMSCFT